MSSNLGLRTIGSGTTAESGTDADGAGAPTKTTEASAVAVGYAVDHGLADELARHAAELERQARRLCPSLSEAEDLVQETLERAFMALANFRPGTNMRAWLYTIMVRRACDLHRNRRVRAAAQVEPDSLPAPAPDEDEVPWAAVTDAEIRAAVARLDPPFRVVFELHEMRGLAYQEIAIQLDIPISTVGTRLRRAREKLRVMIWPSLVEGGRR